MAISELQKQGHSVRILLRNPFLARRFGRTLPWTFTPFITPFDPISFIVSAVLLLIYRPDAVVSTKKSEYFILGVLTRIFGIRHILRLGIVRDLDSPWKRFVYTRLNEGIIVNARRTKENFLKYDFVDQDRIKLIYNGIPPIPGEPGPSPEDGVFRIVSVGTLTPRKGFHLLIEALSLLDENVRTGISLTILGSGMQKAELQKQIKEGHLEDQVELAGFQSDPVPFLRQADLFALVSENEGISNALLEAMMLGLPVLTTPSGGTAEFMTDGENGYLTERTAEDIASRLASLMEHRQTLPETGRRGKARVSEFFSLEKMGRELEAFLKPAG